MPEILVHEDRPSVPSIGDIRGARQILIVYAVVHVEGPKRRPHLQLRCRVTMPYASHASCGTS